MDIRIRADCVEIGGYVNAVERDSKPLRSRLGRFIERICKGAFGRALQRNPDVRLLLNHDRRRDLGSTKTGELRLTEDAIGLRAEATVRDPEVIEKAHAGALVGWSFGFRDRDVEKRVIDGMTHRSVRDLDLVEVSILDKTRSPAYEGTLIMTRDEEEDCNFGDPLFDDVKIIREDEETRFDPKQPRDPDGKFAYAGGTGIGTGGSSGTGGLHAIGGTGSTSGGSAKKWDYPGLQRHTEKLRESVKSVKTWTEASRLYKALGDHESVILSEMDAIKNGFEPDGDIRVLYAALRGTRQAKKELLAKETIGRSAENTDAGPYDPGEPMPDTPERRDAAPVDYTEYETIIKNMRGAKS